jgi:hypothetical protein
MSIHAKVVPSIWQQLPGSAAYVLGKALLWLLSHSSVASDFISK